MFNYQSPTRKLLALVLVSSAVVACSPKNADIDDVKASSYTINFHKEDVEALDFSDTTDFDNANRGLLARVDDLVIKNEDGDVVWRPGDYSFLEDDVPPNEVHPGLWRQSQLNNIHGLFEITPGVYQVRGYDLANMSIIRGEKGWIVVDVLTTKETALAALDLVNKTLGERPISALIFSHNHIDHFGGALALEDVLDDIPIIAPFQFMHEATSENVLAGPTMGRRAVYMYGRDLPISTQGHVGSGLGQSPAMGSIGIANPTLDVTHTGQTEVIDGVEFIFQYTPESEAPSELMFYLPEHKAFFAADVISKSMLNIYTLRGAKVRDALKWSNYIEEARLLFDDSEAFFGGHHWPLWGRENIDQFLRKQRDVYKYIHDQTLRLAYQGKTPDEIANELELPESLNSEFFARGYYGTLRHNSRAVYQFYFGWYDGNPVNLNPLPPEETAVRYIEAMGGEAVVMELAKEAVDNGEYRWAAEILNHVVFASESGDAKRMLAYVYRQLGYQSESGPWRDNYLTGAKELLDSEMQSGVNVKQARGLLEQTPVHLFFDAMAAQFNGPDAEGVDISIAVRFTDLGENYLLWIENSVLHHRRIDDSLPEDLNSTIDITHGLFLDIILGEADFVTILSSDEVQFSGSRLDLLKFFSLQDRQTEAFSIVTP